MTSSLHPPRRCGLPREPPRGGRSLCREASNELRPFALVNGHHIVSGKPAQNAYGGRPVNELRVPKALLLLILPNGQEQKEAQGLACCCSSPGWGFSYQPPLFLASQRVTSTSTLRPN